MHHLAREAFEETVLAHPLVVVDLAQVVATGVGQDDDHHRLLVETARHLHRRLHGGPRRATHQNPLFARDAPGREKGIAVVDLDDAVDQFQVDRAGDEVLADPLHLVRLAGVARVERAFRVGADDHHRRLLFLEEAGHTGDGAARSQPTNHHVDAALRLLPDFGTGRLIVCLRVRLVEILVRLEGARDLVAQPFGDRVVAFRRLARNGGRTDHHFGAVGAQEGNLLRRLLVRHHEDHPVTLQCRRDGQRVAGIPGSRFNDGATRLQQTATLGIFDHAQPDPILDAATGIERLHLRQDGGTEPGSDALEPHQRRVPDGLQDAAQDLHWAPLYA